MASQHPSKSGLPRRRRGHWTSAGLVSRRERKSPLRNPRHDFVGVADPLAYAMAEPGRDGASYVFRVDGLFLFGRDFLYIGTPGYVSSNALMKRSRCTRF